MAYDWYTMLTIKQIEALARKRKEGFTTDGTRNLYLQSRSSGTVNWVVRTTVDGKRTNITIGQWPEVSPNTARSLAPSITAVIKEGHSVTAVRNALLTNLTPDNFRSMIKTGKVAQKDKTPFFEQVARDWYNLHLKDGLSDGPYKTQVIQQLQDYVFPKIGRRPINQIKRQEIIEAIREVWVTKNPTGKKIRGNIERIFDFAIDNELIEHSPAPPVRSMPKVKTNVTHFLALPYERTNELWNWLQQRPKMQLATYVGISMALLLGKRTSEIRSIRWEDVDLKTAIWVTRSSGMKMRKEHRQPLPRQVVELLQVMKRQQNKSEFILGSKTGQRLSPNTMLKSVKAFDNITVHGFRATLSSWATEQKYDERAINYLKAHQPKYLDAAYNRLDMLEERRLILQRWADFVTNAKPQNG